MALVIRRPGGYFVEPTPATLIDPIAACPPLPPPPVVEMQTTEQPELALMPHRVAYPPPPSIVPFLLSLIFNLILIALVLRGLR